MADNQTGSSNKQTLIEGKEEKENKQQSENLWRIS